VLILLPPDSEQRAIVDFLDRETAKIDALAAKKERLIELLQEKRSALITRAVTNGLDPKVPMKDSSVEWLGKIPAHWQAERVKWVAHMESGHTPDKKVESYWQGGDIPWVSLADTSQLREVDYIRQYKTDRDPREPLFAYGRCLAHFAVDPDLVYVTTHLAGPRTRFLPFNRGKFGGAGNPPVPPTQRGYATGYLWEEIESLSRIIAELNERFGLNLGPEHRVTLGQMMEKLADDAGLDAAARVNTRENVRLTFDHKVEAVIQEIVDSNFELYKRITDDRGFGDAIKNFLFDQYLRGHRDAAELIKRGESKTLEFKSTLRWNLKEDRQDDKFVTHSVLKTVAAFLNTDGGDLLIGVADDGTIVGTARDRLDNNDKFMRHLTQVVRNGMGDRAGTCIDPKTQVVQSKTVCIVSCQRSPEPVFLKWKGMENSAEGDFFVRSGPGTVRLPPDSAREYVQTRFPGRVETS
jgi:hypothetical protein